MTGPNFFVVGAPKSGTTAMCAYLGAHPNIFFSEPKEPAFFATDMPGLKYFGSHHDYASLFAGVAANHLAVGEGSTCYLYSQTAVAGIQAFNPHARLIAMLRNPVDAVASFHAQLCYDTDEDVHDFAMAWSLQEARRDGRALPRHCRAPARLQYRRVFLLGSHVQRLLERFPRSQVKLILFDDFVRAPDVVYEDLLAFLNVPSDHRRDFPRINPSKRHRFWWLARWTMQPPRMLQRPAAALRRGLGLPTLGIGRTLIRWNRRPLARPPIGQRLQEELTAAFRDDILKLARLLDRDLSHWLTPAARHAWQPEPGPPTRPSTQK